MNIVFKGKVMSIPCQETETEDSILEEVTPEERIEALEAAIMELAEVVLNG